MTLYLHIGTPKTGTSALQSFLNVNADYLKQQGLYYPCAGWSPERMAGLKGDDEKPQARKTLKGRCGDMLRRYDIDYRSPGNAREIAQMEIGRVHGYFQSLCSYAASMNCDVLLSSEGFWEDVIDKAAYFEQLKGLSAQIKVIVYLRRQDVYLSSSANQRIKANRSQNHSIKYLDCLQNFADESRPLFPDYLEELEKIANEIGRENIVVRRYKKGISIVDDFLPLIGITKDARYVCPPKTVNPHLSKTGIKIMCWTKAHIRSKWVWTLVCYILLDIGKLSGRGNDELFLWDENVRKDILDKYEESNNRLARLYMNEDRLFDR